MRNIVIVLLLSLLIQNSLFGEEGYKIELKFKSIKDSSFIFGHYFDAKIFVNDTISINKKGFGVIEGKSNLPEGIYVVYLSDSSFFDVLIGQDQNFSVEIPDHNQLDNVKISGSVESQKYKHYQQLFDGIQKEIIEVQNELKQTADRNDSIKLTNKLSEVKGNFSQSWDQVIDENEGNFLSVFFRALKEISVPDFKIDEGTTNKDSALQMKRYYYYKEHYFDNIALSDKRLLFTPFFSRKVDYYINKVVAQTPDSLTKEGIGLIESTRSDSAMFKYMTQRIFNFALNNKMMGMDAMLSAISKKYYLSGEATWVDEKFLKDLREQILRIEPTLLGKAAHDLKMESNTGEYFRLSEVRAPYTVLVFWEPSCGHCKKQIPILKKEVGSYLDKYGIKVFAVYTQQEREPWEEFIENHELFDWINVFDPDNSSNFRYYYNIQTTPMIYILDKSKKIVAKQIGAEDLPGFFDHEVKFGSL